MIPEEKNYVYGSAAPKIKYNVYEENKILKAKKKQRANNKVKLKAVFSLMAIFAAFLYIMFLYAQITEVNYKLNKSNITYNDLKNDNMQIKLKMEKDMDLNKVREIAETRLEMQKPDRYQIVYVKVPKKDVTKVALGNNEDSAATLGVIASVSNMFGKIVHFFD